MAKRKGVAAYAAPPRAIGLRLNTRLARCRNLLEAIGRRSIDASNLTLPQFEVLAELARAGSRGRTFVELSRLLLVTSGNLTGIVDRLEVLGLARRRRDRTDRRVIWVALTARGRHLMRRLLPRHAVELSSALAGLPRGHLKRLNTLLHELDEYLQNGGA